MTQPSQDNIDNTVDSKGGQLNYIKQIVEDKSQLILTILALGLALLAIGMQIQRNADEQPRQELIDAKIDAEIARASERLRVELAQQVADAKASADTGRQHARVALDKVEDFRAKLAEKGIKVAPLDGH